MHSSLESPLLPARPFDSSALLRSAVLAALRGSGYRSLWNVDCQVQDGLVILSGAVPSFYLKQVAQSLILRLDRVKEVRNTVRVARDR
jgi:osmotically-inducible protein OsmY